MLTYRGCPLHKALTVIKIEECEAKAIVPMQDATLDVAAAIRVDPDSRMDQGTYMQKQKVRS